MRDHPPAKRLRRLAVLLLAVVAGCGDGSSSDSPSAVVRTGVFVGTASGSDACVAVVAGTEAVVAFVNDAGRGLSLTFGGPRDRETTVLDGTNDAQLEVQVARKRATGAVTIDGVPYAFTLQPAGGRSGLYRAAGKVGDEPVWAGWIVQNDGTQCATAGVNAGVVPAPALDTSTQTFAIGEERFAAARVEPDVPTGDVEDPGTTFAGGSGFSGGVRQFGGFSTFGFGGFSTSFGGGFGGGFSTSFGGGFGGGGFSTASATLDR